MMTPGMVMVVGSVATTGEDIERDSGGGWGDVLLGIVAAVLMRVPGMRYNIVRGAGGDGADWSNVVSSTRVRERRRGM